MPNWCSNSLVIKGKRKDLIEVKKKLDGSNGCFTCENIIPFPNGKWDYTWCVENWGSKWEPSGASVNALEEIPQSIDFITDSNYLEEMDALHYCYSTAWSPVNKVVEKLSEMYPDCYFIYDYEEGGNDFHVIEEYLGGLQIRELNLPSTITAEDEAMYKDDGIEGVICNVDDIGEIANSGEGYFEFAEEVFKERGFDKHIHKYE